MPQPVMNAHAAPKPRSLQRKILLPLLSLGLALILLGGFVTYHFVQTQIRQHLLMEGSAIAAALVAAAENEDTESPAHSRAHLQRIVTALAAEPAINMIVLASADAGVIGSSRYDWLGLRLEDIPDAEVQTDLRAIIGSRAVATRLQHGGDEFIYAVGVRLSLSGQALNRPGHAAFVVHIDVPTASQDILRGVYAVNGGGGAAALLITLVSLLLLAAYGLLRRHVLTPLARISRQLQAGPNAHPLLDPGASGGDEVGELVAALNASHAQLREESMAQLRLLSTVVDSSLMGITIADATCEDTPIIYANRAFCAFTGYTLEEVIGKNCRFLTGPATDPSSRQQIRTAIAEQHPITQEIINYRKNGEMFWNRLTVFPVLNDNGQYSHFVGYQADITEEIRARYQFNRLQSELLLAEKERLSRSEQRFVDMIEGFCDAIVMLDADMAVRYANPAISEVYGLRVADVLGRPLADWLHPDETGTVTDGLTQTLGADRSTCRLEHRLRTGGGAWDICETSATRIHDSAGQAVLALHLRRVTEQRRADEALQESEAHFRTMANAGQALIWTAGLDKQCDYFNQVWLDFTGRALAQELGDGWTESVHPDDLAHCFRTYTEAFDRRERFSMDYRMRRHDGEYRWIQDDGTPRYNSRGEFIGYIGHCFDITERRRNESRLRELSEAVEQAVDGIAIADLGGTLRYINRAFAQMHGYTSAQLLGRHLSVFHNAAQIRDEVEPHLAVLQAQGSNAGEVGHIRADG
ncbi:MAG: PAS domain-containing protein, partial [Candidatus Methylumidiphilus sp.]